MHTAYFYNSKAGDRKYNADSFGEMLKPFFTNGVFNGNFAVTANNNMSVTVSGGYGFINGKAVYYSESETFDLEVASGTLNRIDSVVLRRDDTARDIYLEVLTGSYANNPTPPEIKRDDGIYDLKLCDIYIAKGVIKITQQNITDTRLDNSVCGFVATTIETVDTSTLFHQYLSWYENFTAEKTNEINQRISNWNQDANNRLDEIMDAISKISEDNGEWDIDKPGGYKKYSTVTTEISGDKLTFLAINPVPEGTSILNELYWVPISVKGNDGNAVITELKNGDFAFQVEGDDLYLYFLEGTTPPPFAIEDGYLVLEIEE